MTISATRWPFEFIVDSRGASIGWAAVHSRIVSPSRHALLAELRRANFRFIGMTSDGDFPRGEESDPLDYGVLCEAWCHCFREPDRYLPAGAPRTLLSASDFTDYRRVSPDQVRSEVDRPHDFVYVGATEPWKREAKSWDLARACAARLGGELGLRGVLVGVPPEEPSPTLAEIRPTLPWPEFLALLSGARFLLVPNLTDASPRVITEALCLDVPVLVNRRILGGWKYVNAFTGEFFDGENDVVAAARECLARHRSPRNWFRANHGPYLAGRRLLAFMRSIDPSITEREWLGLAGRIVEIGP